MGQIPEQHQGCYTTVKCINEALSLVPQNLTFTGYIGYVKEIAHKTKVDHKNP